MIAIVLLTLGIRDTSNNTHINLNPFITQITVARASLQGMKIGGFHEMIKRIGWYEDPIIKSELNVVLFIPLGLLISLSSRFTICIWKIILFGFSISLTIEITQLYYQLGWFDTSDLLHNMIGTLLGYDIYKRILSQRKYSILHITNRQ